MPKYRDEEIVRGDIPEVINEVRKALVDCTKIGLGLDCPPLEEKLSESVFHQARVEIVKTINEEINKASEDFIKEFGFELLDEIKETTNKLKNLLPSLETSGEEGKFKSLVKGIRKAISVRRFINDESENIFDESSNKAIDGIGLKTISIASVPLKIDGVVKNYPVRIIRKPIDLHKNGEISTAIRKAVRSSIIYNLDDTIDHFKKMMKNWFAKKEVERTIRTADWLSMIDPNLPDENQLVRKREELGIDNFNLLINKEIEA